MCLRNTRASQWTPPPEPILGSPDGSTRLGEEPTLRHRSSGARSPRGDLPAFGRHAADPLDGSARRVMRPGGGAGAYAAELAGAALRAGPAKRNVVVRPGTLSAQMRPPWASTNPLAMWSPRPTPVAAPFAAWRDRANCVNSPRHLFRRDPLALVRHRHDDLRGRGRDLYVVGSWCSSSSLSALMSL